MYEFPPFRLDTLNQCLVHSRPSGDEARIHLPPKAFAILRHLVDHANQLVTHSEMMEKVWPDTFVQPEVLATHIRDIRAALGDDARKPRLIETLARRGYRFIGPIRRADTSALRHSDDLTRGRLVGRDSPLSTLHHCYGKATAGHRQLLFVTGEPGIGKTALCSEFIRRIRNIDPPPCTAWGQCIEGYGIQEPYFPILKAVGDLCRAGGDPIVRVFRAKAPTCVVQFSDLVSAEQRAVLEHDIRGATSGRMLREVLDALDALGESRPVIVVLDDLQWADHATVGVVSEFARRQQPAKVILLGLFRPLDAYLNENPIQSLKDELLARRLCSELSLGRLTESDIATYLDPVVAESHLRDRLANLLYRRSEGNPLFMVAALEHSLERKLLLREEGGPLRLTAPLQQLDLDLPQSLRRMIESQLNSLTAAERSALEASSVAGGAFSPEVVAPATEYTADQVEDICYKLGRRNQIVRTAGIRPVANGRAIPLYEFVHDLYRDVLYEQQSPGRRSDRHQRIGSRLESLYGDHAEEVAAELALHFEHASDWPRTVKYLILAAENSEKRYAHGEAIALLSRALSLMSKLPGEDKSDLELRALERLATIYVASFDSRCVDAYERLSQAASERGLPAVAARALLNLATCLSWDDAERCLGVAERAAGIIATLPDPVERARMQISCHFWRVWAGGWRSEEAARARRIFLETADQCSRAELSQQLIEYGMLQWASSEYAESYRCVSEGLEALSESLRGQNPYLSIAYQKAQFYLPRALLFRGEWGKALQILETSIELADKNGDSFPSQMLRLSRAWVHYHALDFRGVVAVSEPIEHAAAASFGGSYLVRLGRLLSGSADVALGNLARAHKRLMAAKEEMDSHSIVLDWCFRLPLHAALTELWLSAGDLSTARDQAARYLELALATEDHTYRALALEVSARAAFEDGDISTAEVFAVRSIDIVQAREVPLAAWHVYATATRIWEGAGERALSRRHRELASSGIAALADSLGPTHPLKSTFLSSPLVSKVLNRPL